MIPALERRLKQFRSRAAVRAWEYRQRNHSHGVWFRLRRVLTDASAAYSVSGEEMQRLLADGYKLEPVGAELEPQRQILFVPAPRVAQIAAAKPLTVGLGAELLATRYLVLTPFPGRVVRSKG